MWFQYTSPTLGFASSSPAAHGRPRPSGPAARRPGGPEAHTNLLSIGKSTRMHSFASGLGAQMKDGEFEFVYHFNNHFNLFRSFLSLHVAKWKTLSFSVVFVCLQQQTETRIQMIKMVNN